jgi:hypothetical protein
LMRASGKRLVPRLVVVLLVAALIGVPWQASALASEPEHTADSTPPSPGRVEIAQEPPLTVGTIRETALRLAREESHRFERSSQSAAGPSHPCTASVAEKLALLYAVVGGSLMLAYGPREKEGAVWTLDGKSETVAGVAALALSVGLFRDIRKKSRAQDPKP